MMRSASSLAPARCWPLALPMIPYMQANLARKRRGWPPRTRIIAVSTTIAADLRARAPELSATRMETIANPIDVAATRDAAAASAAPIPGPYALYLGKLAPNKGTEHLRRGRDACRARLAAGHRRRRTGPAGTRASAAATSARDIRFVGWVERAQAVAWLAHASLLVFPSRGPESLSRVLLEASALGVPIAAMNTGGTPDIVTHGETGLLSTTIEGLAADVRRLRADEALRARLGEGARRRSSRSSTRRPSSLASRRCTERS